MKCHRMWYKGKGLERTGAHNLLISIHNKQMEKKRETDNNGARALINQSIKSNQIKASYKELTHSLPF